MAAGIRVLCVDDEPDLLEICKLFLENAGDFSVATTDSAPAALELLANGQFDAIISDYQMPVMDGIRFLIEVRANFGQVPFILFTGKGREEVVIQAINSGADFYLQKGGEPEAQFAELVHKVRQAVQRRKAEIEVSEAGERYKTLINVSNTGAWEYYADAGFVWCSPEYFSMLGRDVSQFNMSGAANLKEAWVDLLHPDDQERASRHFSKYLDTGSPGIYENRFRMQHADGHWVWIWSRGWTLRDKDGVLTNKTIGTHIDITRQMLADQDLRESEEKYRLLIDNSHDIIYTVNLAGIMTFVSPSWTSLLGHPVDQVIGKPFREFIHPEDVARCLGFMQGAINTGLGQASIEYRAKHIDGSYRWHATNAVAIRDASGTTIGGEGIASDITDRKRAEEDLRLHQAELTMQNDELHMIQEELEVSREEYQDLYDHAPAGYFTISPEGLVLKANLTAAALLSVERSALITRPLSHFILPDDQDSYYLPIRRLASTKQRQSFELRMLRPGGTPFWAQVVAEPAPEGDRENAAYNMVVLDISERKQAEERLSQSEWRQRLALQTGHIGAFEVDLESGNGIWTPELAEIWGIPDNFTGNFADFCWEHTHPGDLSRIREEFAQVGQGQNVSEMEFRILRPDGTLRWITWKGRVIKDPSSGNIRAIGVNMDITGCKRTEEALKKSREEYRRLVEQSSEGIWLLDKEFLTVYVNPAMEEMLGYTQEEMIGRSWYDFGDPGWVRRAKELEQRRQSGIGEPHDFLFIHKDGRNVFTRISTTPLYDNGGSFDGAIGVLSDITRQKQAEEAMRESGERYHTLFDTMTQGVVYQDREGRIIDANPAAMRILGLSLDQMKGRSSVNPRWRPVHEDGSDFPGETHPVMVALQTGKEVRGVVMGIMNPEKEERVWIRMNAVPQFRAGEDTPYQVYTTFDDITGTIGPAGADPDTTGRGDRNGV